MGFMNDKLVLDVQRKGAEAHHFVLDSGPATPFNIGDMVQCTVDWQRRHDHMQQHSGIEITFKSQLNVIITNTNSDFV